MRDYWPFSCAPNSWCFTTESVLRGGVIVDAFLDTEETWSFFDANGPGSEENAKVVSLQEIVERDGTILDLAEMRPGTHAFRSHPDTPWELEGDDESK